MHADDSRHGMVRKVHAESRRHPEDLLEDNRQLHALVASYQIQEQHLRDDLAAARAAHERALRLEERLRASEDKCRHLQDEIYGMRKTIEAHEREQGRLRRQLSQIDQDDRRCSDRFAQLEQQNNNLTNLYVVSYRLHGTLNRQEVIDSLKEIIVNLVGSEEMALFEMHSDRRRLSLLDSNGIQPEPYQTVPLERGLIGNAARNGRLVIAERGCERVVGEEFLSAAIPLKLEERVAGLIAIFRLLPQKSGIGELDLEIFDLLASQAAVALYCTALHARLALSRGDDAQRNR